MSAGLSHNQTLFVGSCFPSLRPANDLLRFAPGQFLLQSFLLGGRECITPGKSSPFGEPPYLGAVLICRAVFQRTSSGRAGKANSVKLHGPKKRAVGAWALGPWWQPGNKLVQSQGATEMEESPCPSFAGPVSGCRYGEGIGKPWVYPISDLPAAE